MSRWLAAAAVLALLPACSSHQLDLEALSSASDQIVWEAGQKAVEKKDWESARQYYRRLIDAFPQSEHQPGARIALADTYFEEGGTANYVLAVSSYREFLTLYPQHPKSDYAQYRAGESYFAQKNNPDRDQTATEQALEEYQRLLEIYPESQWVEPARERIKACRQMLARAHFGVGVFYQKTRQAWRSAIGRYETILADYPDFEKFDEVLFRLAECLANAGRYAEARPHLARLRSEFPNSSFVNEAQKLEASFPPPGVPADPAAGPANPPKAATPADGKPSTPPPQAPPSGP
ncbi:MAG TPA: outer membrane protein assembly factor BamD [Vicinamibacteria bacterium]|nr:outer membrane protein assembly factor BamD [Vicinamibacteria bacterium]